MFADVFTGFHGVVCRVIGCLKTPFVEWPDHHLPGFSIFLVVWLGLSVDLIRNQIHNDFLASTGVRRQRHMPALIHCFEQAARVIRCL